MSSWAIGAVQVSGTEIGAVSYNDPVERTWISTSSTDLNNSNNYTGTGPLLTTDVLIFNNSSWIDATATANLEVKSIIVENGYSGGLCFKDYTVTLDGTYNGYSLYISGNGNRHLGSKIIINSPSTVYLFNGNIDATCCNLVWNSLDGTLTDNRSVNFLSMYVSNKLTCNGNNITFLGSNQADIIPLITDASSTIINNSNLFIKKYYSGNFFNFSPDTTFKGSGRTFFGLASNSIIAGLPEFRYLGNGSIYLRDADIISDSTINILGNLSLGNDSIGYAPCYINSILSGSSIAVDFNNFNLSCGNYYPGGNLDSTILIKYRSGQHFCLQYDGGKYNSVNTTEDFSNCQFQCGTLGYNGGDWTFGSNHNIVHTSYKVCIGGNTASSIVTNNKSFYNLTINGVSNSKTVAVLGNLYAHDLTTALGSHGNWTNAGYEVILSGFATFSSTGTVNLGNGLTLGDGTTTFYPGISSVTASSTILTIAGSTLLYDNKGITFRKLSVLNDATLITWGSATTTFLYYGNDPRCSVGDGALLTFNSPITFKVEFQTAAPIFDFVSSRYVVNGSENILVTTSSGSGSASITNLVYSGTGAWSFDNISYVNLYGTCSFGGNVNVGTVSRFRFPENFIMTGNSKSLTFYVSSTVVVDNSSVNIQWLGNSGTITLKAMTNLFIKSLFLDSSKSLTLAGEKSIFACSDSGTPLTLANGSRLTLNQDLLIGLRTDGTLFDFGSGVTLSGSNSLICNICKSDKTALFPAFDYPSISVYLTSSSLWETFSNKGVIKLMGSCTCANLLTYATANAAAIFDFNNFNVTTGIFRAGSSGAACTIYYRNGIFNVSSFDGATYNNPCTHDFGDSTFYCSGNWSYGSQSNIVHNNDKIYFVGSPTKTVTTNNKSFNDIEISASSNNVIWQITTSSHDLYVRNFIGTVGRIEHGGRHTYISGDLIINNAGNTVVSSVGGVFRFTGDNKKAFFSSSAGAVSISNCSVEWTGNDGTWIDNKGVSVSKFTLAASKRLVFTGSGTTNILFSGNDIILPALTLGSDSTLTVNNQVNIGINRAGTSGTVLGLPSNYLIDGTGIITFMASIENSNVNVPAFTYSGTGLVQALAGVATSTSYVNFNGVTNLNGGFKALASVGTIRFNSILNFTGSDSTFTILNSVSNFVASACDMTWNKNRCAFLDYKGVTFRSITLNNNAQVVSSGSATTIFQGPSIPLRLESNSRLSLNRSAVFSLTGSNQFYSIAPDSTFDGTDSSIYFTFGANDVSGALPALNFSGSGTTFLFTDYTRACSGALWYQTGNLNLGASDCNIYMATQDSTGTYNAGIYGITCNTIKPGINARSRFDIIWGHGNYSISSYSGSTYNNASGVCREMFQISRWSCSGNWTFGSNHQILYIPGNSYLTLTGGPSFITSNNKPFNFVELNAPGKTVNLADDFICHGFKKTAGTLNINYKFKITGDYQTITTF